MSRMVGAQIRPRATSMGLFADECSMGEGNIATCDALACATLSPSNAFLSSPSRVVISLVMPSTVVISFSMSCVFGTRHSTQNPSKNADTFQAAKRKWPNTGQIESVPTVL